MPTLIPKGRSKNWKDLGANIYKGKRCCHLWERQRKNRNEKEMCDKKKTKITKKNEKKKLEKRDTRIK